ncbi:hypothetical protein [Sulfobacillus harzensis]|uniref:DUF1453 domain-containing protein n=1 Tax=Sulfobacillus harzensis TaxID=2729629 RepID=A0A7Y0L7B0_9FIRM|nr:hypothetical protein [Sulfobacillus harzensis]NMP24638.1 hypothetical protein [Sulfobacillus harzensis]
MEVWPTTSAILIVLVALMMGVDSVRDGGWAIVRPVTTIGRMILLLGAAATVLFGRGLPSLFVVTGAIVGTAVGVALSRLGARTMKFRQAKTGLLFRTNTAIAILPVLVVLVRIVLVGPPQWLPSPDGLTQGALIALCDFLFLSYWSATYLVALLRGDQYLLNAATMEHSPSSAGVKADD